MTDTLTVALHYLERGWSIFPVAITQENGKWRKRPLVDWKQFQTERPTQSQVSQWWNQYPEAGIGLALGKVSGVIRIDVEGPVPWDQFGEMPKTLEFSTISGGKGYLLSYMEGATTCQLWKGDDDHQELRVQSDGAYTVIPPFQGYEWTEVDTLARVPEWLYLYYMEKVLSQLTKELRPTLRVPSKDEVTEALKHIPADDYDLWIHVGMALKTANEDMLFIWDAWSKTSNKYVEGECAKKWATFHGGADGITTRSIFYWAMQHGWKPPSLHEPLTDGGNANMLVRLADGNIKHCGIWGWLAWDGMRWTYGSDADKIVQEYQKRVISIRREEAKKSLRRHANTDSKAHDYMAKLKSKGNTIRLIDAMDQDSHYKGARNLANSDDNVRANFKDFDKHPFMLNCKNGTLNLFTGELAEHLRSDLLTQICPTEYVQEATCPKWEQFLVDIFPDEELRRFMQRFLGCCITGDITAQVFAVFWGDGANGKSTLIQTIFHVLGGDYSMKAKRDLIISKKHTDHPTSIARLNGKRFVACVETDEFGRLDESLVKELTGDDAIAARRMREDEWQFDPTHKLVLATNHKPKIGGTDNAIWRRILLVPFTQRFMPDDPRHDPDLKAKLIAEASGILNWMIAGCQMWLNDEKKLLAPEIVKTAAKEYRREEDRLGQFIEDCCVLGDTLKIRDSKLQEKYVSWCALNKVRQLDNQKLGQQLRSRGVQKGQGERYYRGIALRNDE